MLARLVSMTVDCSSNASIYSINIGNWWCCDKYRELSKANSTELLRQRWWWPAGPIPFILQILSTICDLATEKNRLAYYYVSFRITFFVLVYFFRIEQQQQRLDSLFFVVLQPVCTHFYSQIPNEISMER